MAIWKCRELIISIVFDLIHIIHFFKRDKIQLVYITKAQKSLEKNDGRNELARFLKAAMIIDIILHFYKYVQ